MDYLYLIIIKMADRDIMKIGVAKNVSARLRHMERDTGLPCELYATWAFSGHYGHALKNYAVEQQVHHYLKTEQFPMWEHFPKMGGKTECFDCSLAKALSAIALGIRWTPTNPVALKKGHVITHKGYIKNKAYINRYD